MPTEPCGVKKRAFGGCDDTEGDAPDARENRDSNPPVGPATEHTARSHTHSDDAHDGHSHESVYDSENISEYSDDEASYNHCAPLEQRNVPNFFGYGPPRSPRRSSCHHHSPASVGSIHHRPTEGEFGTDSEPSDSSGQIILVATGSCMLLVSGALLMVLCALCLKRCRRRSSIQRTTPPPDAANGVQPPLWEPYPRSHGNRRSFASGSSAVSPKDSSCRHLYVELPDSTLALAVKDSGSLSGGVAATASTHPPMPPLPALLDPNTLDALPASSTTPLPPTIHFAHYMPIIFPASLSSSHGGGRVHASLAPMHARAAGIALAGSGPVRPPSDTHDTADSAVSNSLPLSDARPEQHIDPDLLRRRQSLRLPYQAHEMLHSCNSDSTTEAVLVRVQPPLSAAEAAAIGLPASEDAAAAAAAAQGERAASRDARAAIGLPSIAPPVDAAVGGAMLAALTQRRPLVAPALGLPMGEVLFPCSAPASAHSGTEESQRLGPGVIVIEAARSEPGCTRRAASTIDMPAAGASGAGCSAETADANAAAGTAGTTADEPSAGALAESAAERTAPGSAVVRADAEATADVLPEANGRGEDP